MSVISFEWNGSYGNAVLKLLLLLLKSLFEINLNQMTINSLVSRSVWPARRSRRSPLPLQSSRKGATCCETAQLLLGDTADSFVKG